MRMCIKARWALGLYHGQPLAASQHVRARFRLSAPRQRASSTARRDVDAQQHRWSRRCELPSSVPESRATSHCHCCVAPAVSPTPRHRFLSMIWPRRRRLVILQAGTGCRASKANSACCPQATGELRHRSLPSPDHRRCRCCCRHQQCFRCYACRRRAWHCGMAVVPHVSLYRELAVLC